MAFNLSFCIFEINREEEMVRRELGDVDDVEADVVDDGDDDDDGAMELLETISLTILRRLFPKAGPFYKNYID